MPDARRVGHRIGWIDPFNIYRPQSRWCMRDRRRKPNCRPLCGIYRQHLMGLYPRAGRYDLLTSSHYPTCELPAHIITAGWNLLVAKILSFCIAFGLLLPLSLVRDKLCVIGNSCMNGIPWADLDVTRTIFVTIIYEGLLIGFWFIDHGSPLRWYCLFLGIMKFVLPLLTADHLMTLTPFQRFLCSLCVQLRLHLTIQSNSLFLVAILGDISDERFMKKANTSDITQFTLLFPSTSTSCMCSTVSFTFTHRSLFNPLVWIIFWFTLSAGSLVGFSFLGQLVWQVSFSFFVFESRILPR